MRPLFSIAQLRSIEHAAAAMLPTGTLMQRAGAAAAQVAVSLLRVPITAAEILVIAGPGNNGGDALVVAACLATAGARVSIKHCADPAALPADARQAWQHLAAIEASVKFIDQVPISDWSLVIDGLFGIGLTRPIEGALGELIRTINQINCPRLALDVPSGLDADTGNVIGEHGYAFRATHTVTFIGDKPGLHTGAGRDYAGVVSVADLLIEPSLLGATPIHLSSEATFANATQARQHYSHKGSYGDVIVLGGADGMSGAVLLAARAALFAGSGRVFAAFMGTVPTHDALHPELMCRSVADLAFGNAAIVIGPGLGTSPKSHACLMRVLKQSNPLVIDADALNLIAEHTDLQALVQRLPALTLLTPHPLEASRLLGCSTAAVQANRLGAAARLAQRFQATIILKGSGTIIAQPDGQIIINSNGNPALATAGSGDVLAGVCGALAAQGWSLWHAAVGAVWLHGRAADALVEQGYGPIGLTAGELPAAIRRALNALESSSRKAY